MDLQLANYLVDKLFCDEEDARVHDNYAGRGMHTKTTAAVEVSTVETFFKEVGTFIQEHDETFEPDVRFVRQLGEMLKDIRWDNLGHNMLFY